MTRQQMDDSADYPALLLVIDRALLGKRGVSLVALALIVEFGLVWASWVGWPDPVFGSSTWTIKNGARSYAATPWLWYTSFAVALCTLHTIVVTVVLFLILSKVEPAEPKPKSFAFLFLFTVGIAAILVISGTWLA